jgi:hypothetical protein
MAARTELQKLQLAPEYSALQVQTPGLPQLPWPVHVVDGEQTARHEPGRVREERSERPTGRRGVVVNGMQARATAMQGTG